MKQRVDWFLISLGLALAGAILLFPHLAYGQNNNRQPAAADNSRQKMDEALTTAIDTKPPQTALTRKHLGVLDYRELVTPTAVYANTNLALPGSLAGPVPLDYGPYQNFSDGRKHSARDAAGE